MALLAIIRLRGRVDVPPDVDYTLKLLRLHRKFSAALYPDSLPGIQGMLRKVQGWVTWGEVSKEVLVELLRKRGRVPGNEPLTDEYVREKLGLRGGIEELAEKLLSGELQLHRLEHLIKPVFRLHPPKGGFKKSTKRMYGDEGELGYRGSDINKLLKRMI